MEKLTEQQITTILDLHRNYEFEHDRPLMAGYFKLEFEGKEYFASTDGYRIVLIPVSDIKLELNRYDKEKMIEETLIPTIKYNLSTEINTEKIVDLYKSIPEVFEMVDCPSCDGDGEFVHYGHCVLFY